jgi:hypothetical protein
VTAGENVLHSIEMPAMPMRGNGFGSSPNSGAAWQKSKSEMIERIFFMVGVLL